MPITQCCNTFNEQTLNNYMILDFGKNMNKFLNNYVTFMLDFLSCDKNDIIDYTRVISYKTLKVHIIEQILVAII